MNKKFVKKSGTSDHLRKTILLYSILSGILLAIVVAIVCMVPLYRTMRAQREDKLFTVLHTRAAGVEIFLWERREMAQQVASRTLIQMIEENHEIDKTNTISISLKIEDHLAEAIRFLPSVVAAYCVNNNGIILGKVGIAVPDKILNWTRKNTEQSETFRLFDIGGYHLLHRSIIKDKNEKILGTIILLYKLDTLHHRLARLPEASLSEDTFIGIAENGKVQVFLKMQGQSKNSLIDKIPHHVLDALRRAISHQTGLFKNKEKSTDPYLIAYCPIDGTRWGIAIRLSENALLADIHKKIIATSIYITLLILFIGIGMFLMLHPLAGKLVLHSQELEKRIEVQTADLETERKRLLALSTELQAANEDLDAFSQTVAHDLRAPLVVIQGFSDLLLTSESFGGEDKRILKRISTKSRFMANLIKSLLWYARAGKDKLKLQPVDFSKVAEEVSKELREEYPQHSINLTIHPHIKVTADKSLLNVLMENLIGNSWKYTLLTDNPKVEIGSEKHEGEQVYFVRDNGTGFDMMFADKLFEPFQRFHNSSEFAGTGIGLSTVKRIVLQHKGRIWAESSLGKGATFYFTLQGI
ncbi:MAG: sensor histidine kinase [Planctomycetota bacterium]|jgi:signal transduction histidine kinase